MDTRICDVIKSVYGATTLRDARSQRSHGHLGHVGGRRRILHGRHVEYISRR